jgi:hypothetical protein
MNFQFPDRQLVAKALCAFLIISVFCIGMIVAGCGSPSPKKSEVVVITNAPTPAPTPDLQPNPTDFVPASLEVETDVQKDPITGEITVRVDGGMGMNLIDFISVSSIGEKGEEDYKEIRNPKVGDEVSLKGTPDGKDRVTIYKSYKNGKDFITDDMVLEGRDTASSGGSSTGGGGSC